MRLALLERREKFVEEKQKSGQNGIEDFALVLSLLLEKYKSDVHCCCFFCCTPVFFYSPRKATGYDQFVNMLLTPEHYLFINFVHCIVHFICQVYSITKDCL